MHIYICMRICAYMYVLVTQSCQTLQHHELQPTRLLSPWNLPGKNTGVGSHSPLQGIFLTQGSNPGLWHCGQILYHLNHEGSPIYVHIYMKYRCIMYSLYIYTHTKRTCTEIEKMMLTVVLQDIGYRYFFHFLFQTFLSFSM